MLCTAGCCCCTEHEPHTLPLLPINAPSHPTPSRHIRKLSESVDRGDGSVVVPQEEGVERCNHQAYIQRSTTRRPTGGVPVVALASSPHAGNTATGDCFSTAKRKGTTGRRTDRLSDRPGQPNAHSSMRSHFCDTPVATEMAKIWLG